MTKRISFEAKQGNQPLTNYTNPEEQLDPDQTEEDP